MLRAALCPARLPACLTRPRPPLCLPCPRPPPRLQSALAGSFTYDQLQAKSYLEVKGSTLANQCSSLT